MNCPKCTTPNPDTTNFCTNCGQTLRGAPAAPAPASAVAPPAGYGPPAYAPPPYAPSPYAPPGPAYVPLCPMCRSPYLQYFHNGKGTCSTCRYIFGWGYMPNGQIALYANPGFL